MAHDCHVLIVGAGPVGTALALELALQHVSFRIIDKAPVRDDKSRALVVQPRTLELLNRHGAADAIVQRGRIMRGGSVYVNRELAVKLDLDDLGTTDTEFPLPLNISQAETERFLDECLSKYGISVERPVTATSIAQDASGVTTTLTAPGGESETVRSTYVAGCDGAHSIVRHSAKNLTFKGSPYPQEFILCDVHLDDSNLPQDRISLHSSRKGVLVLLPLDSELVRLVATSKPMGLAQDQEVPTLDQFQAHFTAMTPPGSGTLRDPIWLTRFRLHHRCVNRYRDGRLFVAGDAAHIHSPAGGQGMNAGIQDAINLGWKLAHALALESQAEAVPTITTTNPPPDHSKPNDTLPTTTASPPSPSSSAGPLNAREEDRTTPSQLRSLASALLDSYDAERRPVGRALLRGTDRLFARVSSTNPLFVPLRNLFVRHVVPWLVRSARRRRRFFLFISEFGVSYRGRDRFVGSARWWRGPVRGGDRLGDGRVWALLGGHDNTGAAAGGEDASSGGGGGGGVGLGPETGLQRVCAGAAHHLLLFGGGGDGAAEGSKLKADGERVVRACRSEVRVHYVVSGQGRPGEGGAGWYADPEGKVHAQFGFGKKAGYVLVRPDGYVAHIGPLAKLDQLVSFLRAN